MHPAFDRLAKRVGDVQAAVLQLTREVEAQNERETKLLEEAAYGDEFDEGVAPVQEAVVAAFGEVLEALDRAHDELDGAKTTLKEISEG